MSEPSIITLPDGTKINRTNGEVIHDEPMVEDDVPQDAKPKRTNSSRTLLSDDEIEDLTVKGALANIRQEKHTADLPVDTKAIRPIAVVAALTLFGITDNEIAFVCGIEHDAVNRVKESDKYESFVTGIIENIMNGNSDNIRHMFQKASFTAAHNMIDMLRSDIPDVRQAASTQILDRAGFRPADIVEHRIRHENELRIIHIRDDNEMPVIETEYHNG